MDKLNLYLALLLIITMNSYVVYSTYYKEGFIKSIKKGFSSVTGGLKKAFNFMSKIFDIVGGIIIQIVRQVFNIIPIKAVRDHYKRETQTGNVFKFILLVGWATFKLILLIGVMPYVLMIIVMLLVIWGIFTLISGMFRFVSFMFRRPKLDLNPITLANNQTLSNATEKIALLEEKINKLQPR